MSTGGAGGMSTGGAGGMNTGGAGGMNAGGAGGEVHVGGAGATSIGGSAGSAGSTGGAGAATGGDAAGGTTDSGGTDSGGGVAGALPCGGGCAAEQVCFEEACVPCAPTAVLDLDAAEGVTVGTVGAACYLIDAGGMESGNCGSFGGRKLSINDELVVDCSSEPLGCHYEDLGPHEALGGYVYLEITAGLSGSAWFTLW